MKKILFKVSIFLLIVCAGLFSDLGVLAQNCSPEGLWQSHYSTPQGMLRIGISIEKSGSDNWQGFLISPDQSEAKLSFTKVNWIHDSLLITAKKANLQIKLLMSSSCDSLIGLWIQGFEDSVSFGRCTELPAVIRDQVVEPPYPYREEVVRFNNPKGKFNLEGTLTYPEGKGPFPAVIMISGSGPQNRDEELLAHKPFLIIADYLTRNGFAVLRYDDRGTGNSEGDFSSATSYDFATDAEAAFKFLETKDFIDADKIGLIGHSEGGMIAPVVAAKNHNVAFIILLAGPGTTGKQILMSQSVLIGRADSVPEDELQRNLKIAGKAYEIIEKEKNAKKIQEQIKAMVMKEMEAMSPEERKESGLNELNIAAMAHNLSSDWFTTFVRFDPAVWLKKVRCPILALNGERDLQVPADENLQAIRDALKDGKCPSSTILKIPELNHLFQHCKTGSPREYFKIHETFSPEVLKIMGDWLKEQFGS